MDVVNDDFDRMGIQDWRGIAMDREGDNDGSDNSYRVLNTRRKV